MSLEDFPLKDSEPIDNSIIKRDFLQSYHQQGTQLTDPNQNIEFILVKITTIIKLVNHILNLISQCEIQLLVLTITLEYDWLILVLLSVLPKPQSQRPEVWRWSTLTF